MSKAKRWLLFWAVAMLACFVLVVRLACRRGELLAALEGRSTVAGFAVALRQSAVDRTNAVVLEELRQKLSESRKALRNLEEKRSIAQRNQEALAKLYCPAEEPQTLEEWREAQPEKYEALRKSLAGILRYAAAKRRLRGEYLARLDLGVLTAEEQRRLLETLERIDGEEARLLAGDGEAELYFKARGRRAFGDMQRWFYEGTTAELAIAADWRQVVDEPEAKTFVAACRALARTRWNTSGVQPLSPSFIRGTSYMLIDDPEAPDGKRLVHVKVEPGWQPE